METETEADHYWTCDRDPECGSMIEGRSIVTCPSCWADVLEEEQPATAAQSGPTTCRDGLVTVLTDDGPELAACTGPCCTAQVRARYVEPGFTAAMLAAIPDEEIF